MYVYIHTKWSHITNHNSDLIPQILKHWSICRQPSLAGWAEKVGFSSWRGQRSTDSKRTLPKSSKIINKIIPNHPKPSQIIENLPICPKDLEVVLRIQTNTCRETRLSLSLHHTVQGIDLARMDTTGCLETWNRAIAQVRHNASHVAICPWIDAKIPSSRSRSGSSEASSDTMRPPRSTCQERNRKEMASPRWNCTCSPSDLVSTYATMANARGSTICRLAINIMSVLEGLWLQTSCSLSTTRGHSRR